MERMKDSTVFKLVVTALMAALSYVSFTYLKIPIPTISGDMTALHIGNAFCVIAAILLGGVYGGVAGSLGMTIADVLDPVYITSAPKTFILKLCIGLISGFVAHKIAHITESHDTKYIIKWTAISSICGLGFNVIFDPIVGYLYKTYILGVQDNGYMGGRNHSYKCDCQYSTYSDTVHSTKARTYQIRIIPEDKIAYFILKIFPFTLG